MNLRPLLTLLICLVLCIPAAPLWAVDQKDLEEWRERILRSLEREGSQQQEDSSAPRRESLRDTRKPEAGADTAAARAQKQYGGIVLAVSRSRDGYRVRLLLENGRVTTVKVPD